MSVPGKVFAHVLLARLQPLLERVRRSQQSGFTRSRSTLDTILALRLLSEIHSEYRKPLRVAYVDPKAAFDYVDRAALWKTLSGVGVPTPVLDLIRDYTTAQLTGRVRLGTRLSSSFRTTSGVRQDCVLALFCCVMDHIMKWVVNGACIQVGDKVFTDLDYVDDAVQTYSLLARTSFTTYYSEWSLRDPSLDFMSHGPRPNFRTLVQVRQSHQTPLVPRR